MSKYLILLLFIIIFLALALGFFSGLTILNAVVNLIVLILISSFLLGIKKEGLLISLSLAVFYDLYLYSFFGLSVIAVLLIYFILSFLESKISHQPGFFLVSVSVFFASIVFDLIVLSGLTYINGLNFSYILLYNILPSALLNLVLAFPFYIIALKLVSLLKLYKIIGEKEKKILVGF
ncbi:hypothetical protein KJ713_00750 [Patescibacteria group bacterium]|nr:hypothetical protein [Patescibacteria group bacterium]